MYIYIYIYIFRIRQIYQSYSTMHNYHTLYIYIYIYIYLEQYNLHPFMNLLLCIHVMYESISMTQFHISGALSSQDRGGSQSSGVPQQPSGNEARGLDLLKALLNDDWYIDYTYIYIYLYYAYTQALPLICIYVCKSVWGVNIFFN